MPSLYPQDSSDQGSNLLTFTYAAGFSFQADSREVVGLPVAQETQDDRRNPGHLALIAGGDGRNPSFHGLDAYSGITSQELMRTAAMTEGQTKQNPAHAGLTASAKFAEDAASSHALIAGSDGGAESRLALLVSGQQKEPGRLALTTEGKPQEAGRAALRVDGLTAPTASPHGLTVSRDGEDSAAHHALDSETGAGVNVFIDLVDSDLDDFRQ